MISLLISDAYKQSHREQYPEGTTLVYSNFTPRSDKHAKTNNGVVVFGVQAFILKIKEHFDQNFFNLKKDLMLEEFVRHYKAYFGSDPETKHIEDLHDLGYLPIKIDALPEGTICPIGVPMLTIYNTKDEFFWVTNFLETIISTELWLPMTSATIANEYKLILNYWADLTCVNNDHVQFQGHDFSMRGMAGLDAAVASSAGHLLSFVGSDTIPAVWYLQRYYGANVSEEMVAVSVPATEHSVMSMGTKVNEIDTFRRLITETYPNGIISIVSDTWDLWKVLTEYLPELKEDVMKRDGTVVIRPDSGDPVEIICGKGYSVTEEMVQGGWKEGMYRRDCTDEEIDNGSNYWKSLDPADPTTKGVIELLWDIFGGTENEKGYKVLDSHIGAIYGDSITLERANEICSRLEQKGFASSNIVFGIGSYTYQYNTRDTYGFAMKATYGEVNGEPREIYKDPVTDDGTKKSLKGLIQVVRKDGVLVANDQCTWEEQSESELNTVFVDGKVWAFTNLADIRGRLEQQSKLQEKEIDI